MDQTERDREREREHDELVEYMCMVLTPRICRKLGCTPADIWRGQKQHHAVAEARKRMVVELRRTIGRTKRKGRPGNGPWQIFRGGIPDGYQPFSFPEIARWLGGHHTTYVLAVKRHKEEQELLAAERLEPCPHIGPVLHDGRGCG